MKAIENKKKKHPVLKVGLGLIIVLALTVRIYTYFGGFGTGPCADVEELGRYAGTVESISIPEGTRIVALGEASHGNIEFQQLKLDVFKLLVEREGVRAFVLEGDFGGCEYVNRYIHGGDGTAAEAAAAIGFAIYRTDEMAELISYMREYNESAQEGDDLRFYGIDMQRYGYSYAYLAEAVKTMGLDSTELERIWDGEDIDSRYSAEQRAEILTGIKEGLACMEGEEAAMAEHFAEILLQNIELEKVFDFAGVEYTGINYTALRDKQMAENTMWVLGMEEQRGRKCIFVSGHNGHVERVGNYGSDDNKEMGNLLADELGKEYFVIGTDFYRSSCNLPKGESGERMKHTFYSYDSLAKAAKKTGVDRCWLDFSEIPEDSGLREQIDGTIYMGSLGEGYSAFYMNFFPVTYRIHRCPSELYDGMILVPEVHPTEIRN